MDCTALIKRYREGDEAALGELFKYCGSDIYRRALEKTGDKARARQVTRDTFAEITEQLKTSDAADGFLLYVQTLAVKNAERALLTGEQPVQAAPGEQPAQADASEKIEPAAQPVQPAQPALTAPMPAAQPAAGASGVGTVPIPIIAPKFAASGRREQAQPPAPAGETEKRQLPAAEEKPAPAAIPAEPPKTDMSLPPEPPKADPSLPPEPVFQAPKWEEIGGDAAPVQTVKTEPLPAEGEVQGKAAPRRRTSFGRVLSTIFLILLILLLLWAIAGILMSINLLPRLDLGYAWFNRVCFPLF